MLSVRPDITLELCSNVIWGPTNKFDTISFSTLSCGFPHWIPLSYGKMEVLHGLKVIFVSDQYMHFVVHVVLASLCQTAFRQPYCSAQTPIQFSFITHQWRLFNWSGRYSQNVFLQDPRIEPRTSHSTVRCSTTELVLPLNEMPMCNGYWTQLN